MASPAGGEVGSLAARRPSRIKDYSGDSAMKLTENESMFLQIANNPDVRERLLDRLAQLGLLAAFLAAENGTSQ